MTVMLMLKVTTVVAQVGVTSAARANLMELLKAGIICVIIVKRRQRRRRKHALKAQVVVTKVMGRIVVEITLIVEMEFREDKVRVATTANKVRTAVNKLAPAVSHPTPVVSTPTLTAVTKSAPAVPATEATPAAVTSAATTPTAKSECCHLCS